MGGRREPRAKFQIWPAESTGVDGSGVDKGVDTKRALFCVDARRREGGRAGPFLKLETHADTVVMRYDMPLGSWATEGAAAVPHAKPSRIDLDFILISVLTPINW